MQAYLVNTVYLGTASTNLQTNLMRYLRAATNATAQWIALLTLAAGA